MTNHPLLAAALMLLLLGAIAGWCAGWAARGSETRAWHRNLVRQLTQTRTQLSETRDQLADTRDQLADALDQLDHTRTWAQRMPPPPAPAPAVHVHVDAAPPSWLAQHPDLLNTPRTSTAMPVLPAKEVP